MKSPLLLASFIAGHVVTCRQQIPDEFSLNTPEAYMLFGMSSIPPPP